MAEAINMINKVNSLEEESHTIKLIFGLSEEGRINGNILNPTVAIIPMILIALINQAILLKRSETKISPKWPQEIRK